MNPPEFSRLVRIRPTPPERLHINATGAECKALAERFGIVAIGSLKADVALQTDGAAIAATGTLTAEIVQTCAVSRDLFTACIEEPIALRFVPGVRPSPTDEERELSADEPDEIEFEGESFDLGEAVAQSLGLGIDPYAEGPGADSARKEAGIADDNAPLGPLAEALAQLKR